MEPQKVKYWTGGGNVYQARFKVGDLVSITASLNPWTHRAGIIKKVYAHTLPLKDDGGDVFLGFSYLVNARVFGENQLRRKKK